MPPRGLRGDGGDEDNKVDMWVKAPTDARQSDKVPMIKGDRGRLSAAPSATRVVPILGTPWVILPVFPSLADLYSVRDVGGGW
jgi:hypothetical protein